MLCRTQTIEDHRFLIPKFLIKIIKIFKMSLMKIIKIKCNYNKKKIEVQLIHKVIQILGRKPVQICSKVTISKTYLFKKLNKEN